MKDIDRISEATGIHYTYDNHLRVWRGADDAREVYVWRSDGVWRYTVRVKTPTTDDSLSRIINQLNRKSRPYRGASR